MQYTSSSSNYIGQEAIGYMINIELDPLAVENVMILQDKFKVEFGDSIWYTPSKSLHITLLDWLAPLKKYNDDKDILYESIFKTYDQSIRNSINDLKGQEIIFNRINVSQSVRDCNCF